MRNTILLASLLLFSVGAAGQERTTDTLPARAPADRITTPATGHRIDAAQRRSASEVNAEAQSKRKTQSHANQKPNPQDKPLTEPASGAVNPAVRTTPSPGTNTGTR